MKPLVCAILAALVVCGTTPVRAQNGKGIAIVDFKKVMAAHPKAKELEQELQVLQVSAKRVFETKQKEMEELESNLDAATNATREKNGLTQVNIDVVRDLQSRILAVRKQLIDLQSNTRKSIAGRQEDILVPLAVEIRELISKVNGGEFAVVLDISALSRDGLPFVVDRAGAVDLTSRAIAQLPAN